MYGNKQDMYSEYLFIQHNIKITNTLYCFATARLMLLIRIYENLIVIVLRKIKNNF